MRMLFAISVLSVTMSCSPSAAKPPETGDQKGGASAEGVDTSDLNPREKAEYNNLIGELMAPCPDIAVSIAQCISEKRNCKKCVAAAKQVAQSVRDGLPPMEVDKRYQRRFDPKAIKTIPLDNSPTKGPDNAPVTIFEFMDYECPHCGRMLETLDTAFKAYPNKIRLVIKFLPMPVHPHARMAAKAGVAAMKQKKFWEMHDKMLVNQKKLEQSDLDEYAKQVGLDLTRFHADMQAADAEQRLVQDRDLADNLRVGVTPTLFVNGREFDPRQELNDWIGLEVK